MPPNIRQKCEMIQHWNSLMNMPEQWLTHYTVGTSKEGLSEEPYVEHIFNQKLKKKKMLVMFPSH